MTIHFTHTHITYIHIAIGTLLYLHKNSGVNTDGGISRAKHILTWPCTADGGSPHWRVTTSRNIDDIVGDRATSDVL